MDFLDSFIGLLITEIKAKKCITKKKEINDNKKIRLLRKTVSVKCKKKKKDVNRDSHIASSPISQSSFFNPYVHNRVPGYPPPQIFINYFLKFFFSIWAPGSSRFDFFRSYLIGCICEKKKFSSKFICWKKVIPGHKQGTRVPTRKKFI